jgi:hypothetical protein
MKPVREAKALSRAMLCMYVSLHKILSQRIFLFVKFVKNSLRPTKISLTHVTFPSNEVEISFDEMVDTSLFLSLPALAPIKE